MKCWLKTNALICLVVLSAVSLGTTVGVVTTLTVTSSAHRQSVYELPLHATASDSGDTISVATGPIDDNLEGLFILDYESGRLTMDVLNFKREGVLGGHFERADVYADLKLDLERLKKPSFLMVTGRTVFGGGRGGAAKSARCAVYVVDQSTGRWIAYGMPWIPGHATIGRYQEGRLNVLLAGTVRPEEQ